MKSFYKELEIKIKESYNNDYGKDNYDELRFGPYSDDVSSLQKLKNKTKQIIHYKQSERIDELLLIIHPHKERFEELARILNQNNRNLLIELIAFRLLGYKKIKLSKNNQTFKDNLEKVKELKDKNCTINPNFMHFILEKFNLKPIGYDLELYFTDLGVSVDFLLEQYAYKENNIPIIEAAVNDVVFDIGGCYGDTALYFAHKVGKTGKVYSFEFIPGNIKLHQMNCDLNKELKPRIELIRQPVDSVSNIEIYFKDNGPGSRVAKEPFKEQTGTAVTISVDDFVTQNNLTKVDFIKMDIEGAELDALNGAINTIKKYKPKLAIAIYHSIGEMVDIPLWIKNLNMGYEIYIDHFTIHHEETVCFAK
ncbi:FkbM family methyltransferase [Pedobacter alpinus]|uniref:FkbM family methyltransferase n=1 Tax=Pedobacter alpinus TaxID=1590643 RepID=A0ABW5TP69_9SPHI